MMTEADARRHCQTRDRGRCRVPGCAAFAQHLHHVVYRSHLAPAEKWRTSNLLSLCASHHALVHAGVLHIEGDADGDLTVTGDDFDLVALCCDHHG